MYLYIFVNQNHSFNGYNVAKDLLSSNRLKTVIRRCLSDSSLNANRSHLFCRAAALMALHVCPLCFIKVNIHFSEMLYYTQISTTFDTVTQHFETNIAKDGKGSFINQKH